MTRRAAELLQAGLELPEDERAGLAEELLASLDGSPDKEVEAAWAAEIERRARRVLSGESKGTAWEEVKQRLQADLER
jgi:putative addiction module component (TIGR02574 family)